MFTDFSFNSPWYYYFISILIGLTFPLVAYYRNKKNKDVPPWAINTLFVLRALFSFLITLLLLNIFLKQIKNQTENPVVILAVDNSASMVLAKDSAWVRKNFESNFASVLPKAAKKFEIKTLLFGERSRNVPSADFLDKETDIDNLFKDVENNFSGQNIGALVVVTDGIYNRGFNPLYSSEKFGFPVYAIACGDTTIERDAALLKVNHNQVAYLGNNFPVEVIVGAKKLAGRELVLSVFKENKLLEERTIKVNSENFSSTCQFSLSASQPGVANYQVIISGVEKEKNLMNNRLQFAIDVIDNRDKVLLIAKTPHPDLAAVKDAISSFKNYELVTVLTDNYQAALNQFALVIFHGFDQSQSGLLEVCRNNNIPFWIINPVVSTNLPGIKINNSINRYNDSEPYMEESFALFNISSNLKKFIDNLPAVKTFFGNYSLSKGSSGFIKQRIGSVETDNPVQFFSEENGLKYSLFLGDGLWRWRLRDYAEHDNFELFNELVIKTVQYLSVKSDKSFFRLSSPRIVNENEEVFFAAEVYNKSYEAINLPDVTLMIVNEQGKKFNYTFSKTGKAYQLNVGRLSPGEYVFEAKTNSGDEVLIKKGKFTVKEVMAEKINTVANHLLLKQVCARSGGQLYYPVDLQLLDQKLLDNETIKPITYSESSVSNLVELKWIFAFILLLVSAEWLIRKRYYQI